MGFLLWKRDDKDDRRFRAPLILLPVVLERKSIRSGIKMQASDDEPRFNTTLLEMLRKDFEIDIRGLEGALPQDHSGIDVSGIWNIVRKAIKDAPGFEVVEDVVLGHFSFAKYLMWKDLVDRTAELRNNAVVRHLLDTPRETYGGDHSSIDGNQIDRTYHPADLLVPLPADSSQMAAIATADGGKDFIIIGPPGTGKSQTISNAIAHLLGKGKTVLFVSEKTAALDVVHRRLSALGLGRFCLELHSNKAKKAEVLEQLRDAWTGSQTLTVEQWQEEAERLKSLRDRLNAVVDRLHQRRSNGMNVYHAIGIKIRDQDLAARAVLNWPPHLEHSRDDLQRMRTAVDHLRIQAMAVKNLRDNPLGLVAHGDWSPQWEGEIVARAGRFAASITKAEQACTAFLSAAGLSLPKLNIPLLYALGNLATVLLECSGKQAEFALESDATDWFDLLHQATEHLKHHQQIPQTLSCTYAPMAWQALDGQDLAGRWSLAVNSWWPKRFFAQRKIRAEMQQGGASGQPDPAQDSPILAAWRVQGQAIDKLGHRLSKLRLWQAHETDTAKLTQLAAAGQHLRSAAGQLADDTSRLLEIRTALKTLVGSGNDLLAPDAVVGRTAAQLENAVQELKECCDAFEALAGQSISPQLTPEDGQLTQIRETVERIAHHHADLRDWCGWRKRRSEALDLELAPLVTAIENDAIKPEQINETFEAAYCAWWSAVMIGKDDVLRTFSPPEHNDAILKFRELDDRFQLLTADYVKAKLSGRLPQEEQVKRSSSWGVLKHELQKRARHKPIRQLVQEIPDVLASLAPCMMMSPLSIAQYLPANQSLFDVVIFDEASQITVWDAVGALARGKQVIVAGDPKQMPPSNFFGRSDDDSNGDVDTDGDLESILDEMLGASIPQRGLNLHYRSRRESLIAFSNNRYYDNSLITFPAPVHPDCGVRLVRPTGFYARGKARNNEGEARAIVAEILARLTHPDDKIRSQSIGVVTFNSEQQTLIENLLDDARGKNPAIEWAFSAEMIQEPVFVKNLETVQGDERDVILFSITYGPDQAGHMTMNFGPLNRDGGERRLNVALTRARSEMMVFATLDPAQIDLSRTSARAVIDLKHFLEFAERGPTALAAAVHGPRGDYDSPFEIAVARGLRDRGWSVHPQVGVSAYRIDLGIVHPELPGVYLAGVECDGAMYHSSANARERDKIRQTILEGLGWSLFRVWSTDWWANPAKALDILHQALTEHREQDAAQRAEREQSAPKATLAVSENEDELSDPLLELAEEATPFQGFPVSTIPQTIPLFETDTSHYQTARLSDGRFTPDPDAFYTAEYQPHLQSMIDHIIDAEGPIHEDILIRRIARHHGFQRAGNQIREIVITMARTRRGRTTEDVGQFFWAKGTVKDRAAPARHKGREEEMRKLEHICQEELQAINTKLALNNDPVEMARSLGIARLSQTNRDRLEAVLGNLEKQF